MKNIFPLLLLMFVLNNRINAQWNNLYVTQSFTTDIGLKSISVVDSNVTWTSVFDTTGIAVTNQFYKTIDGGVNWIYGNVNSTTNMNISSISAVNKDTAWVAMNKQGGGSPVSMFYSKILKTTDGGVNWLQQTTANFVGPTNHINFIHFFDINNGICVGDSNTGYWEIYKTSNGGSNWNRINSADIPSNLIGEKGNENCFDIKNDTIWFGTTKGRIYKSCDLGATWNVNNTGLNNITNISMKNGLNGLATNGTSIVSTSTGGINWALQPFNGKFFKTDFCFVPNTLGTYVSTGWKPGDEGSSYSIDNGLNWTKIDSVFHSAVAFNKTSTGFSGGITIETPIYDHLPIYKWNSNITGIQIQKNKQDLIINFYPNPFSNKLNFQIINLNVNIHYSLKMYDILGVLTTEWENIGENNQLELNKYPVGLYVFMLFKEKELIGSFKLIKE